MNKDAKVTIKLTTQQAAEIRQILYEHQKGYSYEFVPERITTVRSVIQEIDDSIGAVLGV